MPGRETASAPGKQQRCESIPPFQSTWRGLDVLCTRADSGDGLIDRVNSGVGLFLVDDERRRDTYCARSAAKKKNAAFEGQFDDAISFGRGILFRLLVLDDLDSEHLSAAPDVTNQFVLLRPVGHALQHVTPNLRRIPHKALAFDDIQGGKWSRNADWIAAEARSVLPRHQ